MMADGIIEPELDVDKLRAEAKVQLGFMPAKVNGLCDEIERLRNILNEIRDYAMTATQTVVPEHLKPEFFYEIRRMATFRVRAL